MFQKIDHISMTVNNVDTSADWYAKIFGFKKVESGTRNGVRFVIIANNDSMFCLYEHSERLSARDNESALHHQIYHFGFRVNDAEKWKQLVKDFNLELNYDEISYPRSKSWYVFDPDGYEIEISCVNDGGEMFV